MDEFVNILQQDYGGIKSQGKSKPASKSLSHSRSNSAHLYYEEDLLSNGIKSDHNTFGSVPLLDQSIIYDDVFGGPPKFAPPTFITAQTTTPLPSSQSYDDIFRTPVRFVPSACPPSGSSSFPVFEAPIIEDDIFGGLRGIRSANVAYDDVFNGVPSVGNTPRVLDDLLGTSKSADDRDNNESSSHQAAFDPGIKTPNDLDELIRGFGGSQTAKPGTMGDAKPAGYASSRSPKETSKLSTNDPPSVVLESMPKSPASVIPGLDTFSAPGPSSSGESDETSRSVSPFHAKMQSPLENGFKSPLKRNDGSPTTENESMYDSEGNRRRRNSLTKYQTRTSMSSPKFQSTMNAGTSSVDSPSWRNQKVYHKVDDTVQPQKIARNRQNDEFWISVGDVKLVTKPTAAPPPSRPPPLPGSRKPAESKHDSNQTAVATPQESSGLRSSSAESKHVSSPTAVATPQESSGFRSSSAESKHDSNKTAVATPQESSGLRSSSKETSEYVNESGLLPDREGNESVGFTEPVSKEKKEAKKQIPRVEVDKDLMERTATISASARAMKEVMERARLKLEEDQREKETKSFRVQNEQMRCTEAKANMVFEIEENARSEESKSIGEREENERLEKEKEARERRHKEREKEKEREREREREKDRIAVEKATQEARERAERAAVERATTEARERAAAEARERSAAESRERAKERAAVERAAAEARERAAAEAKERSAVERANAEARERAAADARERAAAERATRERESREKATVEARERVTNEARARAERAAVERAHAEARERAAERAAAEARERAAAEARERVAAREQQRRSANDLDALFSPYYRSNSVAKQQSPAKGAPTSGQQTNKSFQGGGPLNVKKTASGLFDDWTVLPSVEFQEIEGESTERQRARWERHQRTAERAAKALEEKNQRDLQTQREQAERHRAAETLDAEIKRWAAGKEGNLRALLSTLQYILWRDCGWHPVSLTDLLNAAAVKKAYRKATLCVHPDKVQQKGATIHQKYIAEKVFDLLKEAWNKFSSEELI